MDICEVYSLLASHWQSIKNLPIKFGIRMLNHIIKKTNEKENEDKAWQMWLTKYPDMSKETFVPFSEFYKKSCTPIKITNKKSAEELLKEAYNIRKSLGK